MMRHWMSRTLCGAWRLRWFEVANWGLELELEFVAAFIGAWRDLRHIPCVFCEMWLLFWCFFVGLRGSGRCMGERGMREKYLFFSLFVVDYTQCTLATARKLVWPFGREQSFNITRMFKAFCVAIRVCCSLILVNNNARQECQSN